MCDDDLDMSVWVSAREPEVTVEVDAFEQYVAIVIGNDAHGEVLRMTFSRPGVLDTLGRQLVEAGRRLTEILRRD